MIALAVAATVVALVAAAAPAATPKKGNFQWGTKDGSDSVAFAVKSTPRKVEGLTIESTRCKNAQPVRVETKIKVKASGKFAFEGAGHIFFDNSQSKVTVRGKFVTAKKAKGTVSVKACDLTLKFTARYHP